MGWRKSTSASRNILGLLGAALIAGHGLYLVFHPGVWTFLHGVDLIIHEAGHVIFAPFGEVIGILGGSMMQLLVPLAFGTYFLLARQPFGLAFCAYWTGESLVYVANYVSDARAMALPLLGGDGSIHDWNYLLGSAGLLGSDRLIAGLLLGVAACLVVAGAIVAVQASWPTAPLPSRETP